MTAPCFLHLCRLHCTFAVYPVHRTLLAAPLHPAQRAPHPGSCTVMRVSSGKVGFADTAEVRFLRAADQVPLGAPVALDMTAFGIDFETIEIPVDNAAIGETVIIEFNFVSDGSADAFSGLTIDNVSVSAN